MKKGDIYKTNSCGEVLVIDILENHRIKIKFLNTSYIKEVYDYHLKRGAIYDEFLKDKELLDKIFYSKDNYKFKVLGKGKENNQKYLIHFFEINFYKEVYKHDILYNLVTNNEYEEKLFREKIYPQHCGDSLKILEYLGNSKYKVEFLNFPFCKEAYKKHILDGKVDNPLVSKYYISNLIFKNEKERKNYLYIRNIYSNLLQRCYDENSFSYDRYGKKGIKVCKEWKECFENFYNWYLKNSEWNFNLGYKLQLDKDILCNIKNTNKIYSPDTCLLIPSELNQFLKSDSKEAGINKKKDGYFFTLSLNNGEIFIRKSKFKTFKEAKISYAEEKYKYWKFLISKYKLPNNIKEILLKYDFSWKINFETKE